MDPENEQELMEAIDALTAEKTVILIAHRLKTVRQADQILVLDRGRIVQQGTHDALAREDGLYRFSRNPMYVSYFVYFAGCVLLTRSRLLAALVLLFQLSEHWIILAEERWCREQFGAPYEAYRKRVRRYL